MSAAAATGLVDEYDGDANAGELVDCVGVRVEDGGEPSTGAAETVTLDGACCFCFSI